jgi:hypothetical protein
MQREPRPKSPVTVKPQKSIVQKTMQMGSEAYKRFKTFSKASPNFGKQSSH